MSRICGRSIVGKYTSFKVPCETVNHTRLEAEYAVATASFWLDVQRGSTPGPPKASPSSSSQRYSELRLGHSSLMIRTSKRRAA